MASIATNEPRRLPVGGVALRPDQLESLLRLAREQSVGLGDVLETVLERGLASAPGVTPMRRKR